MAKVNLKIKNYDAIRMAFARSPERMAKELNTAIAKTILKVESAAKREAPVNKQSGGGNLRQSIKSRMTGQAKGIVEVGAEYAVYVHEGTRPHMIRASNKKALANRRTGQFFGRTVNHPGTAANPFLQRAVDVAQKEVDSYFIKAVENVFK